MKLDIYDMAEKNRISEMKKLIKDGIDINKANESDCTPLYLAILNKHEDMALLLNNGADGSLQDKDGFTDLHYATEHGLYRVAEYILKNNPDVLHIENKYGNQPLMTAVHRTKDSFDMVKLFLKYGANKDHKSSTGYTPFNLAKKYNVDDFTKLFKRY